MMPTKDFRFFVEADRIEVRFVSQKKLGRLSSDGGWGTGGTYRKGVIKLPRYEYRGTLRAALLHELGHHLYKRQEINLNRVTEEDVCDMLTWLPSILTDRRNKKLRRFLLEKIPGER
jgi:hypothetical protein